MAERNGESSVQHIWREIGELAGRVGPLERDQEWIKKALFGINRKLNWVLGVVSISASVVGLVVWWMIADDVPPLGDGYDVENPVREYLDENLGEHIVDEYIEVEEPDDDDD